MRVGVVVVGAGGHAKVVVATLQALGVGVRVALDDDESLWGGSLLGVPVAGPISTLADLDGHRVVLALGDNRTRQRLAARLESAHPGLRWAIAVHPSAVVHPSAQIGPGGVVFAGAVVQPDALIGAHAIVNTGATVDHDCRLGDFVHLAPGSHLAGGVVLDGGAFVGMGAVVLPHRRVGAWATVGAGGVVVEDVADGVTVAGVPARALARPGQGAEVGPEGAA